MFGLTVVSMKDVYKSINYLASEYFMTTFARYGIKTK